MSRRLLTAASCAALLLALAWAAPSSAKPPDLPYLPKDTLTPETPSNLEILVAPSNAASQTRLHSIGLWLDKPEIVNRTDNSLYSDYVSIHVPRQEFVLQPVLFPLRASARRSLAHCLLWTAHPMLSLAPVDDYLNDLDDESCQDVLAQVQADATGVLILSGVGVNSDAGLTGSLTPNESNYVVTFVDGGTVEQPCDGKDCGTAAGFGLRIVLPGLSPTPIALDFGFPAVKCSCPCQRAPEPIKEMPKELPAPSAASPDEGTEPASTEEEHCTGFHISTAITGEPEAPVPEQISVMPKDLLCEPPSVCPWMRGEVCPDRHVILLADPDLTRDVIDNLERLHHAETLLESARRFGRAGHLFEALKCLNAAMDVCPASRIHQRVALTAADVFVSQFLGATKAEAGAEEQSEPAKDKEEPQSPQSLHLQMMKRFNAAYKEGRFEDAERYATQAHELNPDDPVAEAAVEIARCQQRMHAKADSFGLFFEVHVCCGEEPAKHGYNPCCGMQCCGNCCSTKCGAERDIEKKLQQPVTMSFQDAPLRQVLDDLRDRAGINIFIDKDSLDAQEVSLEHPVTITLEDVALKSALGLILKSARLAFVVKDEAVQITTERGARGKMQRRVYEVADLLCDAACPCASKDVTAEKRAETLMNAITTRVAPDTWAAAGGPGTIDFYPCTLGLVVNQTADVQEQVAELLESLRRQQGQADEKVEKKADDCEEQETAPCCPPRCCEQCQEMHQAFANKVKAEELLAQCRRMMYAGRQKEAAVLARQAYQLDPKTASADPLVYKLQLPAAAPGTPVPTAKTVPAKVTKPARKPVTLCPCLPPIDPGVVQALDKILVDEETVKPTLYIIVEEETAPAAEPKAVPKPFRSLVPGAAVTCAKDAEAAPDDDAAAVLLRALTGGHGTVEWGFGPDGGFRLFSQVRRGGAVWHVQYGTDGLSVWASPSGGADAAPK
jgi:tetratricopeptide (TPR) repeat protein